MAGHSHWAGIKHKKGKADKQRSKLFSKLSREITVAAKLGLPDIEFNPKKSYNCQAFTAALYISASLRGILLKDIQSPRKFKEAFPSEKLISFQQPDLF